LVRYDDCHTKAEAGGGMDQARTTPPSEQIDSGRLQRTQRVVVAGYVHEVSERHSEHGHVEPDPPDEAED
jgi:hypothetical protein